MANIRKIIITRRLAKDKRKIGTTAHSFFLKKNGPIPASFCLFSSFSHYNFNNWKKHRWCAWDSNPGPQDGRCRRIHWAVVATPTAHSLYCESSSIRYMSTWMIRGTAFRAVDWILDCNRLILYCHKSFWNFWHIQIETSDPLESVRASWSFVCSKNSMFQLNRTNWFAHICVMMTSV